LPADGVYVLSASPAGSRFYRATDDELSAGDAGGTILSNIMLVIGGMLGGILLGFGLGIAFMYCCLFKKYARGTKPAMTKQVGMEVSQVHVPNEYDPEAPGRAPVQRAQMEDGRWKISNATPPPLPPSNQLPAYATRL